VDGEWDVIQDPVAVTVRRLARREASGERVSVRLGPYTAFLVVAALRVMSRQPSTTPAVRSECRRVGETLASRLPETVQAMLALGWGPAAGEARLGADDQATTEAR
jgi:hypothetical protein